MKNSIVIIYETKTPETGLAHDGEDDDPMSVVSNLFDVAMVFALALMVALVSRYNMTEMFSKDNFTMVKNPGKENMEIITKDGQKINRYTPSRRPEPEVGQQKEKEGRHCLPVGEWQKSSMFRKINNRIANPLKQKILL